MEDNISQNDKKSSEPKYKMIINTELPNFKTKLTVSKIIFSILAIVFFSNYFFIGASFYDEIFVWMFPYTYVLFLFSFFLLTYYFLEYNYYDNKKLKFLLFFIFVIFFSISILSIVLRWWILFFLN